MHIGEKPPGDEWLMNSAVQVAAWLRVSALLVTAMGRIKQIHKGSKDGSTVFVTNS